jgi:hypothetical protein
MDTVADPLRFLPPSDPLDAAVLAELRLAIGSCPDLAFAHLVDVAVPGRQTAPEPALFVWLVPGAMGSLRAALNLLSAAVAGVLPADRFLDVLILNSAPELLVAVEEAGCLLVERDPEERRRAREAAAAGSQACSDATVPRPWWWPF